VLFALQLVDVLGFGSVLAVCIGMLYLASRIEPHWVSKDGTRFMTSAQELDQWSAPFGRKHEVRVGIEEEVLSVRRRSMLKPSADLYFVEGKVPKPPRGREVYLLKKVTPTPEGTQLALRVPAKSKVVATLDAMVEARQRPTVAKSKPVPASTDEPESTTEPQTAAGLETTTDIPTIEPERRPGGE
jgi:hypothetical protein